MQTVNHAEDNQITEKSSGVRSGAARLITLVAVAMTVVVILLGAFTRLADAGLGCPDWPTCYGHLWIPQTAEDIAAANQAFQNTPVESDKTWPEQIHRIFASSLGVIIIALLYFSVRSHRQDKSIKRPLKLPILLLILVVVQGLFGMWTVTLKLWPQVVTAHLLGGFSTLALLWLLLQRLQGYQWLGKDQNVKAVRNLAFIVLAAVIAQIALGGWTSSNYAALACPDLPRCQNQWLPAADYSQGFNLLQSIGPNYLGGLLDSNARTAIHFSHRIGAVVVSIITLLLAWRLWQLKADRSSLWSGVLLLVLITQVSLGVSNVYWSLPLPIAVAHNGVGAILLLVVVTINHRLWNLSKININQTITSKTKIEVSA